jgi:hypothetical protein
VRESPGGDNGRRAWLQGGFALVGTIVNSIVVIIGAVFGILFRRALPEKVKETVISALGLGTVVIGLSMALKTQNILVVLVSLVVGGTVGELLDLDGELQRLGKTLERWVGAGGGDFARGFVATSLLYCVGSMAILGAIEDGLRGDHSILFAKSVLDGISAVIFASAMGIGVAFSSISVFIYQGSIALLARWAAPLLPGPIITEMSATGGIIIIAIGLGLLEVKRVRVANLLPALFIAVGLAWAAALL